MTPKELDAHMQTIYEPFRYRWCDSGPCACMGCANLAGELYKHNVSKEEWEEWVRTHPAKREREQ